MNVRTTCPMQFTSEINITDVILSIKLHDTFDKIQDLSVYTYPVIDATISQKQKMKKDGYDLQKTILLKSI